MHRRAKDLTHLHLFHKNDELKLCNLNLSYINCIIELNFRPQTVTKVILL